MAGLLRACAAREGWGYVLRNDCLGNALRVDELVVLLLAVATRACDAAADCHVVRTYCCAPLLRCANVVASHAVSGFAYEKSFS